MIQDNELAIHNLRKRVIDRSDIGNQCFRRPIETNFDFIFQKRLIIAHSTTGDIDNDAPDVSTIVQLLDPEVVYAPRRLPPKQVVEDIRDQSKI